MSEELDERAAARVVFAVTLQAIKDHRGGDVEATRWLQEHSLDWLELAGMQRDTADLRRALDSKVNMHRPPNKLSGVW